MTNKVTINFRELFKRQSTGEEIQPSEKGKLFPFPDEVAYKSTTPCETVVCFISMSCLYCIDLLPYLKDFSTQMNEDFILISNGKKGEIEEIKSYFNFGFLLLSQSLSESTFTYGVTTHPYVFYISQDGLVQSSTSFDDIAELQAFLEKVRGH